MVLYKGNPFLYYMLFFHINPKKTLGQRVEEEYMACGQMSILASSCPQCLSNSISLLVNEDIFFPLYSVDGFTVFIFPISFSSGLGVKVRAWAGKLCAFFLICQSYKLSNIL